MKSTNRQILLVTALACALALPAAAGLFSAEGNTDEEKRAKVRKDRDGIFANTRTKEMAKRFFKNQRARLALLEEYHGKIEKSLSALRAGQFLQVEQELSLFVDVAISAELPPLRVNTK